MLNSLHIRNFALIDQLELTFGPGLNILTGETGAGKSIIIDALSIVLGEKASADSIRVGSDKFLVEAVFTLDSRHIRVHKWITDNGLDNEEDYEQLILSREVSRTGKSQCRVNGRLTPVSAVRTIGMDIVDIHGQHEHQSLLSDETHIDLLDNWLGAKVKQLLLKLSGKYDHLLALRRERESLVEAARDRARNLDLYRFQETEIREANLSVNELSEITQERYRLSNSEKLLAAVEQAYLSLNDTASSSINSSLASLHRAAEIDSQFIEVTDQLNEASAYLEEAISRLRHYRDSLEPEPGRLEVISERLDIIHSLQRKYGESVEAILEYYSGLQAKLFALEDSEYRSVEVERKIELIESEVKHLSSQLTEQRELGALQFSLAIEGELADLGMLQTAFFVPVVPHVQTAKGADKVEFVISLNPGEPLRSLAKIASGGEASRIMLAIKSVLIRTFQVPTMIFDEIDAGIGDEPVRVIADKLTRLSASAQILCITHLPQIASRPASAHFFIDKSVHNGRTTVNVLPLSEHDRETEIARMLGGECSQAVLQHAREMLST